MHHDFLASYGMKGAEYLIGITFLVSFIFFWRFVQGGRAAVGPVLAKAKAPRLAAGFAIPEALFFHPGHAWARLEGATATVGVDDFAQRLVGAMGGVELPAVGAKVGQGEKAWSLKVGDKALDMLSPIDGTVVAINDKVARDPASLKADPYGEGWLLKIEPTRPAANTKQLLTGESARKWTTDTWESLLASVNPELGAVAHDGGAPVDGIAQNLRPEGWEDLARKYLLT